MKIIIEHKSNPTWPPMMNRIICIKKYSDDKIFIGRVIKYIWNNTAIIVSLINHTYYIEPAIRDEQLLNGNFPEKGNFIVLPLFGWIYLSDHLVGRIEILQKITTIDGLIEAHINISNSNNVSNPADIDIEEIENDRTEIEGPISQKDLRIGTIYEKITKQIDVQHQNKNDDCNIDDEFKDTSLLDNKGAINLNNLFTESEAFPLVLNEDFVAPESSIMDKLMEKINEPKNIPIEEQRIITNKTISIRNLITTKEDEINEGNKIIKWILDTMMIKEIAVFSDLKVSIHNGYVHIARKGISTNDTIKPTNVPDLHFFKWQYGIPIDYDTLKYVLFQNKIQRNISRDVNEQREAERILSQEYLICMQPEPRYQLWCLKRLIMCWYADVDLQNNIRKIKILINQYRSQDNNFNKKYGILPSIIIYPRYGKVSARLVLMKLGTYFLYYNNIAWKCSKPTYFIGLNDLLWYTNGALDLKIYFRKVKKDFKDVESNQFVEKYSLIRGAEKILFEPRKIT
ncbi:MAG: hypothetical protein Terrestrivirus3_211 [Terrestrivirus sp.]|uniref:Uncharacterized protein n=1 Tax=Terrestrivirus sp. TaxID=2487775 RepID=A0A3G4ZM50_9VIRU|nr:MAG: hypothetical protein Terrestrivirus3_211 [Terrestrivirus sp.]